ncbi:MAG: beta-N-acetylhexosaminidase [Deltaproteobacteria bacterium]|jgi:beta-N-acetylhexosaminidase|nr:beta-N-acetylhexosaminidase [Deltaproteobacteria bacterium]
MDLKSLTNTGLAGQRLMVGFAGDKFSDDLRYLIGELKVGGIILFSQNITSPGQLKDLCEAMQRHAAENLNLPLFIAVDQEGGQVARLKDPFTEFPGNPHMHSEDDASQFAEITAAELVQMGFNMNMAPVLDIAPQNIESIMAQRAFGHDPAWVERLGMKVIRHLQQNSIMAVAKHFPGIGRTTLDSHTDMPSLDADLSDLQSSDIIPFKAAIDNEVSGIMLSHILYPRIDPDWPASLSPRIARDLLRHHLGYTGLTLTDDLDMGAIAKHYDINTVVHQTLEAEIDVILTCHKGPNIDLAFEKILAEITGSSEFKARGVESVERIVRAKKKYLGV